MTHPFLSLWRTDREEVASLSLSIRGRLVASRCEESRRVGPGMGKGRRVLLPWPLDGRSVVAPAGV